MCYSVRFCHNWLNIASTQIKVLRKEISEIKLCKAHANTFKPPVRTVSSNTVASSSLMKAKPIEVGGYVSHTLRQVMEQPVYTSVSILDSIW